MQTLDRDTGWSGINCNPFEGSLMSQRFDQRGLCPRCGGGMKFVIKDVKEKSEEEEFLENVPDFFPFDSTKLSASEEGIRYIYQEQTKG